MIKKTVDGTEEDYAILRKGVIDMSKELPASASEIANVGEVAGQLGIAKEDLLDFTKTMINLGESTNLSSTDAASALAKFASITNMSASDYDKLGSVIVDLGNNFATTESDIVEMSTRLAATGDLAGLSQPQIMAMATAMSSVGIEAEAGGSAMSKLLKQIQVSVETGNGDLQQFASVAGMTSSEFKKAFQEDAVGALSSFIGGLNDTERNGMSAIGVLDEMGLTEVRLSNTILSLANANGVMEGAVETANKAWEENIALNEEAEKRYETTESKMAMVRNEASALGIAIFDKFRKPFVEAISSSSNVFKNLEKQMKTEKISKSIDIIAKALGNFVKKVAEFIGKWLPKLVNGLANMVKNWGTIEKVLGTVIKMFVSFVAVSKGYLAVTKAISLGTIAYKAALLLLRGATMQATAAQLGLNAAQLANPIGLLVGLVAALAGGLIYLAKKSGEAKATESELTKQLEKDSEQYEETRNKVDELTNAKKELDETTKNSITEGLSEIGHIQNLKGELTELVDANGKVKDGYKDRVKFILGELNKALGTEMKLQDGVIDNYKEQMEKIDELIEKQKAQIIWESNKERYETAIKQQKEYSDAVLQSEKNVEKSREKKQKAIENEKVSYEELDKAMKDYGANYQSVEDLMKHVKIGDDGTIKWDSWIVGKGVFVALKDEIEDYAGAQIDLNTHTKELEDNQNSLNTANNHLKDSFMTIAEYEAMSADILAGNYDKVIERAQYTVKATTDSNAQQLNDTAQTQMATLKLLDEAIAEANKKKDLDAVANLQKQRENNQKNLQETMNLLQQQTSTVKNTEPQVKQAWQDLATNSSNEFINYLSTLPEKEASIIQEMAGIVDSNGNYVVGNWSKMASNSLSAVTGKTVEFKNAGNGLVQAIIDGKNVGEPTAITEMDKFTNNIVGQVTRGETSAENAGERLASKVSNGVSSKKGSAKTAGEDLIDGVNSGVSNKKKQSSIMSIISSFAGNIVKTLRNAWNEHSPSKVSEQIASYFMDGIGIGFDKKQDSLVKKIGTYGNEMASELQNQLNRASASVNSSSNFGISNNGGLLGQSSKSISGGKTVIVNQTINSPKAVNRSELYRNTKNIATTIALAK